jgi:5-methylcytosine-specific restriction endonuclease McrA
MIERYRITPPARDAEPVSRQRECSHEYHLCVRTLTSGAVAYQNQCSLCGATGQFVKRDTLTPTARETARQFQPDLQARHWAGSLELARREREAKRDVQQTDWFAWYNVYLNSATWKQRQRKILERAKHVCEACGAETATHVHHLTYDHVGQERLWELVAVCPECHDFLHNGVTAW